MTGAAALVDNELEFDREIERLDRRREAAAAKRAAMPPAVTVEDFWALSTSNLYICAPSREEWQPSRVDAQVGPILEGGRRVKATRYIEKHRAVNQMTWMPGESEIIEDKLIAEGGWFPRANWRVFNLYRPARTEPGNASDVEPWLNHLEKVWGHDAGHIVQWCAQRVQSPGVKVNHAIVAGGAQGIGKDSAFDPVRYAVGPHNVAEVSPAQVMGRFNPHIKSVILRISEARDSGDRDRYAMYDHLKSIIAAPPEVLRCDEKNRREYSVPNVTGVIITTNDKTGGIYLPPDDRRHFVAWSDATKDSFRAGYWRDLYAWYDAGGRANVAAYLGTLDLSGFDPKAPPPKTEGFWAIVDANRAPEDAELSDALERLGHPLATTLGAIAGHCDTVFADWLKDRRNSRQIPHRMEAVGYTPFRNAAANDGRFKINGRRQVVYVRLEAAVCDRHEAVTHLVENNR